MNYQRQAHKINHLAMIVHDELDKLRIEVINMYFKYLDKIYQIEWVSVGYDNNVKVSSILIHDENFKKDLLLNFHELPELYYTEDEAKNECRNPLP